MSTFYILIYEEKNHFIKKGKIVIFLLLVSFIIINIFYKSNFTDLYIFRSSTYIWYLPFLIIGIYTKKVTLSESMNKYFYLFFIFIYLLGIFNSEEVIGRYFMD